MMQLLKYKFYSLFNSKVFRSLVMIFAVLFLTGCEESGETANGKEGNIAAQIFCWQTAITNAVTAHLNTLYKGTASKVASGGSTIILLGFAVWMAFKLLKVLGSFKEENIGEVWTEIFQKLVVCAACAYFVHDIDNISKAINTFVVPIYNAVIELASSVLNLSSDDGGFNLGIFGRVLFGGSNASDCATPSISDVSAMGSQIQNISNCLICKMNSRLNVGFKIGLELIATIRIGAILVGILLLILFVVLKFFFVLFVVDALFKLNFSVYLLPILIIGIPFNYTRKWSKQGLLMFINSSGVMLFLGLLVSVAIAALEIIIEPDYGYQAFEGFGIALLTIVLVSFLFINIPGMGVALSDKFIGGGRDLEFQKKISKFIINSIKRGGAKILGSLTAGTSTPLTRSMEKNERFREMITNLKVKQSNLSRSINSLEGYNDD